MNTDSIHSIEMDNKSDEKLEIEENQITPNSNTDKNSLVVTFSKIQELEMRKKNYKSHAYQKIAPAQIMGLIQVTIMITSFYIIIHSSFPKDNIIDIIKNFTKQNHSLLFNIMHFLTKFIYTIIVIISFICYLYLSFKDAGIKILDKNQKLKKNTDKDRELICNDKTKVM